MTERELLAALPPPDGAPATVALATLEDFNLAFRFFAMSYVEGEPQTRPGRTAYTTVYTLKGRLTPTGAAHLALLEAAEGVA